MRSPFLVFVFAKPVYMNEQILLLFRNRSWLSAFPYSYCKLIPSLSKQTLFSLAIMLVVYVAYVQKYKSETSQEWDVVVSCHAK